MAKTAQRIMPGWICRAAHWTYRYPGRTAHVYLGEGGWHWVIVDATKHVIARSVKPTRRSRKARRIAQQVVMNLDTPFRLRKVSFVTVQQEAA